MSHRTHRFILSVEELAELGSIDALNDHLDSCLEASEFTHIATDISYEAVGVEKGGVIIEATYIPSDENEEEDDA